MENSKDKIKIAWIHNYDRDINPSSGVFMYQLYDSIKSINSSIQIELINIGSINNPFKLIHKYFRFRKTFRKYDILHAQYGSGTGFFTSLFQNTKIISLRGSDWYNSPSKNLIEKIHIWLGCKLTRLSLKRFRQIIVMSERMKQDVLKKFHKSDIIVIPDGIDLIKFFPIPELKSNKFRILFSTINKNNPVKRFNLAKQAFEIFNTKYPESELVFMTGIDHEKVNEFINSVNVVLLTSTHEGWPNIIKEGLACNVPFVSTDVSDLKKISEHTESCKVCEDNPQALAESIEYVYTNFNNEDLRKIVEHMEIDLICKTIVHVYNLIYN